MYDRNYKILQSKYTSIKKIKWQKKGYNTSYIHEGKTIISCEKHRQYFDLAVAYIYVCMYVCMYIITFSGNVSHVISLVLHSQDITLVCYYLPITLDRLMSALEIITFFSKFKLHSSLIHMSQASSYSFNQPGSFSQLIADNNTCHVTSHFVINLLPSSSFLHAPAFYFHRCFWMVVKFFFFLVLQTCQLILVFPD